MELYTAAGLGAADSGNWHQVRPFHQERAEIPVFVHISAGTATVEVEGRNDPDDGAEGGVLKTVADTDAQPAVFLVPAFAQMRVDVTAATGADIRVSVGAQLTDLGA